MRSMYMFITINKFELTSFEHLLKSLSMYVCMCVCEYVLYVNMRVCEYVHKYI